MFKELLEAKEVKIPYTGKTLEVYNNMTSVFPNPHSYDTLYLNSDLKKPFGALVYDKSNGYIGCVLFDRGYDNSNRTVYGFIKYQLKNNGTMDPRGFVWSVLPKEFKEKFPKEADAVKFVQAVNKALNTKKLDDSVEDIIQKIYEKY